MPYKVVIKKSEDSHRATLIADEVSRWSGVAKDTVYNAIINKNLCVRMETEKDEALELKKKFEEVGASVKLIEYARTGVSPQEDSQKNISKKSDEKTSSNEQNAGLLQSLKTDLIIFGKKSQRPGREPDTKTGTEKAKKEERPGKKERKSEKEREEPGDTLFTSERRNEDVKEPFQQSLRTQELIVSNDYQDKNLMASNSNSESDKPAIAFNIDGKKRKETGKGPDTKKEAEKIKKEKKLKKRAKKGEVKTEKPGDLLLTSDYRNEYIKELFRSLRTKVLMGLHDYEDKSLVVTSLDAGSGKSTIASNIAISIAQQNKKTVLIDGDMRRGLLHSFFKIDQSPGLSDFLISEDSVSEEYIDPFVKPTHVHNLFIITSGQPVQNSSELLTIDRFTQLKKVLLKRFEITILDTPPLGAVTDAVVVNEIFSRYLIVVKAETTNVVDMKKKINEFPALREKILGLVLNYAALDKIHSYYKRSKYY